MPRPADPVGALWLAATALREHRGDGHVLAAVGNGLRGLDATVTFVATGGHHPCPGPVHPGLDRRGLGAADEYLADALSGSPFHRALVACPAAGGGRIVALASCRVFAAGAAELALLIEDPWQRQGLGTRLLVDLVAHASQAGLRVLEAQLLAEQAWITAMLRHHGPCRQHWSQGEGRVALRIQPGSA